MSSNQKPEPSGLDIDEWRAAFKRWAKSVMEVAACELPGLLAAAPVDKHTEIIDAYFDRFLREAEAMA